MLSEAKHQVARIERRRARLAGTLILRRAQDDNSQAEVPCLSDEANPQRPYRYFICNVVSMSAKIFGVPATMEPESM